MVGVIAGIATLVSILNPAFPIQFTRGSLGRELTVCIDGAKVERTFAGKLSFTDGDRSWSSYCADVRSPMAGGQVFAVRTVRTSSMAPNYALAGRIVARFFNEASNSAQCAGLQLAIWKAIEDGPGATSFQSGHLQAHAESAVLQYAAYYYQSAGNTGSATILQTTGGQQGSGGSPGLVGQSQIST